MRPDSSASDRKCPGARRPRSGCCQRRSASAPDDGGGLQADDRLEEQLELLLLDRPPQVAAELEAGERDLVHLGLVEPAAGTACALGLVHGQVGVAHQLGHRPAPERGGDPDACCHLEHSSLDVERGAERAHDPVGRQQCRLGVGDALQQDGELVAAEARGRVRLAKRAAQALADRAEERVAGAVAQAVVDGLEVVDVDEEDGEAVVAPGEPGQRERQPVLEERAVGEPRQTVVEGLVAELLLQPLAVGHVAAGQDAARLVRAIAARPFEHDPLLVGRPEPALEAAAVRARRHGRLQLLDIVGVGELDQPAADELAGRVAEQRHAGLGRVAHARIGVDDRDQLGRVLHERPEPVLAPPERPLVRSRDGAPGLPDAEPDERDEDARERDQQAGGRGGVERRAAGASVHVDERPFEGRLEPVERGVDALLADCKRLVEPAGGQQPQLLLECTLVDRECGRDPCVEGAAAGLEALELRGHLCASGADRADELAGRPARRDRLPLEAALLHHERPEALEGELLGTRQVGVAPELHRHGGDETGGGEDDRRDRPDDRPAAGAQGAGAHSPIPRRRAAPGRRGTVAGPRRPSGRTPRRARPSRASRCRRWSDGSAARRRRGRRAGWSASRRGSRAAS